MLRVVDCSSRRRLAIHIGQRLKGGDVVRLIDAMAEMFRAPKTIKTDNGSELISKAMNKWAYEQSVETDFSRPGN